jgi:hypothetical protein
MPPKVSTTRYREVVLTRSNNGSDLVFLVVGSSTRANSGMSMKLIGALKILTNASTIARSQASGTASERRQMRRSITG